MFSTITTFAAPRAPPPATTGGLPSSVRNLAERISYILGKFGLEVTNTGIVVDKEEKEAPTAEVAAEAE